MANKKPKRPFLERLSTTTGKTIVIIVVIFLCIRILMPYVVLHYANRTLANMHGYYGHVDDIDIALIRGAYQLNNIYINKVDTVTKQQTTFFHSEVIDLSVEWKALFHGAIVGELEFRRPLLRFTKDKAEPKQVTKDTSDFRIVLKKFMPLDVNRFEVNHGTIEYRDSTSNPVVNLDMTDTYILAQNLKSVYKTTENILPASVKAKTYLYEGYLNYDMKLNPLAARPQFDINAELVNTNLVKMNDFFKAYGKFDVSSGSFGLYTEMAAVDGKFKGYVKPIIHDLHVVGPEDRNDSFLQKLWEHIVGAAAMLLKNWRKNDVATKIPIEGNYDNPNIGTLDAIAEVLVNAWIQALLPNIDNEINLSSVKAAPAEKQGFLQKIFGKKKEEQKAKAKEQKKSAKKKTDLQVHK
jgi:hypothetical protein